MFNCRNYRFGKTQKIIRPSSRIQISIPGIRTYTEATERYSPVAYQFFSQKCCSMNHVINFATDKRFGTVTHHLWDSQWPP